MESVTRPSLVPDECGGGAFPRGGKDHADGVDMPTAGLWVSGQRVGGPVPAVRVAGPGIRSLSDEAVTDRGLLALAYSAATHSVDPSTQNGAVVVRDGSLLSEECNYFPVGTPEDWGSTWDDKPLKYGLVVHAEVAATVCALDYGGPLTGATLAVVWYACADCAKVIIEAGVSRVVGHQRVRDFAEHVSPGWNDSIALALRMLDRAGVECVWLDEPVDALPIRVGGQMFDPAR